MYETITASPILYQVTLIDAELLLNRKLTPDEIDLVKQGLAAGIDSVLETTLYATLEDRLDKEEQ